MIQSMGKKTAFRPLLWIAVTVLLSGAVRYDKARGAENMVELNIMYSRDDITWALLMDDLCDEFEREYPQIELNILDPGSGSYDENLKAREAMDEFPDLFELQNVEEYAEAGMLGEIPDSVCSLLEEPVYIDGKIYSVPIYTTTYGIIYNQILFDKYQLQIPKTYDEFLNICKVLKENDVAPLALGGTGSNIYWLDYFFHKEVVNEKTNRNVGKRAMDFASPDYLRMLKGYQELLNRQYALKDSMYMSDSQIINRLFSSDIAMYYTTPGFIAKLILQDQDCTTAENVYERGEENENRDVLLGWFFIPDDEGNTITAKEIGFKFSISNECASDTGKYAAAESFLQFLFENENYREILKSMYGFQTTKRRILYPSPGIQQRLIIDYRYSKKVDSLVSLCCMDSDFKNELSKVLYLLSTESMSVGEAAEYLNAEQGIHDGIEFEEH